MAAKKQFVVQFQIPCPATALDFDRLIKIEETLDGALRRQGLGRVDGHDIGSGTANIFFWAKSYAGGEEFLQLFLKYQVWASEVLVAKRLSDESYSVVWPKRWDGGFELAAR